MSICPTSFVFIRSSSRARRTFYVRNNAWVTFAPGAAHSANVTAIMWLSVT